MQAWDSIWGQVYSTCGAGRSLVYLMIFKVYSHDLQVYLMIFMIFSGRVNKGALQTYQIYNVFDYRWYSVRCRCPCWKFELEIETWHDCHLTLRVLHLMFLFKNILDFDWFPGIKNEFHQSYYLYHIRRI